MAYFSSAPGRCALATTACFLLGPGLASLLADPGISIRIMAILPILASGFGIVAVGTGIFSWARETLIFLIYMPVLLWLVYPGFNMVAYDGLSWGIAILAVGIVLLIWACIPMSGAKAGEFSKAS